MFKNLNPSALGLSGHQSEVIELALTYGFGGMDLNLVEFATRVKLRGMPYARRLIDSAKLRLGTFALPFGLESDDETFKRDLERLKLYAQMAAEVGCTRAVVTIAPTSEKLPYHENFELHRRRLVEVGGLLASSGVRLGVGFRATSSSPNGQALQFIHDFEALSLLVKMVGSPNVGILLSVWDLYVSGGSIENLRGLSAQQIVAVELAGAPADRPLAGLGEESRKLPAPEGAIDLASVLALLSEKRYQGPITLMPNRKTLDTSRRDAAVRAAADGLNRLWKTAVLTADEKAVATATAH